MMIRLHFKKSLSPRAAEDSYVDLLPTTRLRLLRGNSTEHKVEAREVRERDIVMGRGLVVKVVSVGEEQP